jgi:hypothetical protein
MRMAAEQRPHLNWTNLEGLALIMKYIVKDGSARVYELPYLPGARSTSEYVDLRVNPSKIDAIPELRREPLLKAFVKTLNDPSGVFMTHGSAVAAMRPQASHAAIPIPETATDASHWYTTYVTFSFSLLDENNIEHYQEIYDAFPPHAPEWTVCFELQPAYFLSLFEQEYGSRWGEVNAIVCLLWTSGWGNASHEAHDRWRRSIEVQTDFFMAYSKRLGAAGNGVTISEHIRNRDRTAGMRFF